MRELLLVMLAPFLMGQMHEADWPMIERHALARVAWRQHDGYIRHRYASATHRRPGTPVSERPICTIDDFGVLCDTQFEWRGRPMLVMTSCYPGRRCCTWTAHGGERHDLCE